MTALRILLIEDDRAIQKLVVKLLAAHTVVVASSGEEGVDHLGRDDVFDVVICDLGLPAMSGVRVLEHVRADVAHARVPIAVISARTSVQDHALALEAGADVFFEKPLKQKTFAADIERLAVGAPKT